MRLNSTNHNLLVRQEPFNKRLLFYNKPHRQWQCLIDTPRKRRQTLVIRNDAQEGRTSLLLQKGYDLGEIVLSNLFLGTHNRDAGLTNRILPLFS